MGAANLEALASVVVPHVDNQGYIPIDLESSQGRLAEGTWSLGVENYGAMSAAEEVLRIEHVAMACILIVGPWEDRLTQARMEVDGIYQEGSCGSPREDHRSGHLLACDVWLCGPLVIRLTFF